MKHSPDKVWRALTEATKLGRWLYPVTSDIAPVVGHKFAFLPHTDAVPERIDCRVVEAEPGRRLSYTWKPANGETESIVTWTVEPVETGTRLHLRHDGALPSSAVPLLSASLAAGTSVSRRSVSRRAFSQKQFAEVLQWR